MNPRMIDAGRSPGIIASMFARTIKAAMRSTIEELVTPQFAELRQGLDRVNRRIDEIDVRLNGRIDEMGVRLDGRMDRLEERMDRLDGKMDDHFKILTGRIDQVSGQIHELTVQQGRMIGQIGEIQGRLRWTY